MKLSELEKLAKEATPGPWSYNEWSGPDYGSTIYSVTGICTNINRKINADFITAANPETVLTICATFREMLEALQQATNQLRHDSPNDEVWKQARAVIKKAEEML